jgi:hypothetical protein
MRTLLGGGPSPSDIFTEHWRYIVLGAGLLLASVAFWICVVNRGARARKARSMRAHGAHTCQPNLPTQSTTRMCRISWPASQSLCISFLCNADCLRHARPLGAVHCLVTIFRDINRMDDVDFAGKSCGLPLRIPVAATNSSLVVCSVPALVHAAHS